MRLHNITSEPGKFASEFKKRERKRAFIALKHADSFLLITKVGTGNSCISAIDAEHTKMMVFNCHLAEQELLMVIKKLGMGE